MSAQSKNQSAKKLSLLSKFRKAIRPSQYSPIELGVAIIALFLFVFSLVPVDGQFGLLSFYKQLQRIFASEETAPEFDATRGCVFGEIAGIDKLSKDAEYALAGKVTSVNSSWQDDKHIHSEATITVTDNIKKKTPDQIRVSYIGGKVGDIIEQMGCHPQFSQDEEVLVFLKNDSKDREKYEMVYGFMGKFKGQGDKFNREIVGEGGKKKEDLKKEIKMHAGGQKEEKSPDQTPIPTPNSSPPPPPQTPQEATRTPTESTPAGQTQSQTIINFVKNIGKFIISDVAAFNLQLDQNGNVGRRFVSDIPITYFTNNNPYPSAGAASFDSARRAFSAWSNPGANIWINDGGLTGDISGSDGKNVIVFSDSGNLLDDFFWAASPYYLDCTKTMNVNRTTFCKITEADTIFNTWKVMSGDELAAVITHEVGHGLGLGHTQDTITDAIMFWKAPIARGPNLHQDDIDGIKFIYPPFVTISGRVVNSTTGQGIAGVEVNKEGLGCDQLGGSRVTDANGNFSFTNIPKTMPFCLRVPALEGYKTLPGGFECQMAGGKFEPDACNNPDGINHDLEADNAYNFNYTPLLPDLVIENVSCCQNQNLSAGQLLLPISFTVKNQGDQATANTFKINFTYKSLTDPLDGDLGPGIGGPTQEIVITQAQNISAGQNITKQAEFYPGISPRETFRLCLDIQSSVLESNEDNNCYEQILSKETGNVASWPPASAGYVLPFYIEPGFQINGEGPVEINMSNGSSVGNDGKIITLDGVTYGSGLGVTPYSEIKYSLDGKCSSFYSDIGMDDEVGNNGSVVFQVYADGEKLYDSGQMKGADKTKNIENLYVLGKNEIKLVVTDAGDGNTNDHADWAVPYLLCPDYASYLDDLEFLSTNIVPSNPMQTDSISVTGTWRRNNHVGHSSNDYYRVRLRFDDQGNGSWDEEVNSGEISNESITAGNIYDVSFNHAPLRAGEQTVELCNQHFYFGGYRTSDVFNFNSCKTKSFKVLNRGDANCDGKVNAVDALKVLRYAAGLTAGDPNSCEANKVHTRAADANADGKINSVDALLILRYAAGLSDLQFRLVAGQTDADGDGMTNSQESQFACLNPNIADSAADYDHDNVVTGDINITMDNAAELVWGTNPCVADTDGDGFGDGVETYLETDAKKRCGDPKDTSKGGSPSLTWPADLNSTGGSANKLDIQDITAFIAPIRRLDTSPGDAKFDKRWDIVPGNGLFTKYINIQDLSLLSSFVAPMFGGQRGYGRACTI